MRNSMQMRYAVGDPWDAEFERLIKHFANM
jgi:hypothetical protein